MLILFSGIGSLLHAGTPEKVDFLNTGKMYIAPPVTGSNASMYVVNGVQCISETNIIMEGVWKIGGNFIQDSETNVFITDNGYTTSQGTMVFSSQANGDTVRRYITTSNLANYNRSEHYVAFPHIQIETNDTIVVPSKMGIDAVSVQRNGKTGFFLLESSNTESEAIYDASLRITGDGNSEDLVATGSVVVEQYMGAYRNGSDPQLFPFASPFKNTQLSGYFAGNFVRRLLRDSILHTTYVLGNKPSANNPSVISRDQYVTNPMETFMAGAPYLIKPRKTGFNYDSLQADGGLVITGEEIANLYDKEKLTFNGEVYNITPYKEQLFADDTLFSYTFKEATTLTNTVNWVIGNSYTAPLSVDSIAALMKTSSLTFLPSIYIFNPGFTTYQAVSLLDDGVGTGYDYDEIPSKSIFIVRLANGSTIPQGATFTIKKQQLIQGNLSHNLKSGRISTDRDVSFRVTPEENVNVYDLSAIGLRAAASFGNDAYDIPKVYDPENHGFQLFTKTATNSSKLSISGIPLDADSVLLGFKPQPKEMRYTLTVSQKNEGELWLKDLKTNTLTDLLQTPSYTFAGKATDLEDRFIVYFSNPSGEATSTPSVSNQNGAISVRFTDNQLSIYGLTGIDMGAIVYIYDTAGKTVFSGTVSQLPQQDFYVSLPSNVYMISIQGQRSVNFKTINK